MSAALTPIERYIRGLLVPPRYHLVLHVLVLLNLLRICCRCFVSVAHLMLQVVLKLHITRRCWSCTRVMFARADPGEAPNVAAFGRGGAAIEALPDDDIFLCALRFKILRYARITRRRHARHGAVNQCWAQLARPDGLVGSGDLAIDLPPNGKVGVGLCAGWTAGVVTCRRGGLCTHMRVADSAAGTRVPG